MLIHSSCYAQLYNIKDMLYLRSAQLLWRPEKLHKIIEIKIFFSSSPSTELPSSNNQPIRFLLHLVEHALWKYVVFRSQKCSQSTCALCFQYISICSSNLSTLKLQTTSRPTDMSLIGFLLHLYNSFFAFLNLFSSSRKTLELQSFKFAATPLILSLKEHPVPARAPRPPRPPCGSPPFRAKMLQT